MAQETLRELQDRWSRVAVQNTSRVFNTSLIQALELGMMLDCAETIILGALTRTEAVVPISVPTTFHVTMTIGFTIF